MVSLQYKIDFDGLKNDAKFETFTQNMMDQLGDSAPSDSFFHLRIIKDNEEYESQLNLSSSGLQFSVSGRARSPYVSLDKVWLSAKDQIQSWNYQRFDYSGS